jgi:ABC-type lipoprotein release transport system permease subunit
MIVIASVLITSKDNGIKNAYKRMSLFNISSNFKFKGKSLINNIVIIIMTYLENYLNYSNIYDKIKKN